MKAEISKRVFPEKLELGTQEKEDLFTTMWDIIVGEFAHTGTTEIQSAKKYVDNVLYNIEHFAFNKEFAITQLKVASRNIQELQDIMWLYFIGEIEKSEITKVDVINEILQPADNKVRQILPALHFESSDHIKKLLDLPTQTFQDSVYIETHKIGASIVIKELLKIAYLHTDNTYPKVDIKITNREHEIEITVINNKLMPKPIVEWFNCERSSLELNSTGFHKSALSHLRGIKRWYPQLGWNIKMHNDWQQNAMHTTINMPVKFSSS